MSDHDALSLIGQLAGLDDAPAQPPITADQLLEAFCSNRDIAYLGHNSSGTGRDDVVGYTYVRGFCGYNGRRDTQDSLLTGFDDGYDFSGYLHGRGWVPDHRYGDWPYVIYLRSTTEPLTWVSYCEADFTLMRFDDAAALLRFKHKIARLHQ